MGLAATFQGQPQPSPTMGSGKRCLALDAWARPLANASPTSTTATSSSGSSCTTEKTLPHAQRSPSDEADHHQQGEEACSSRALPCATPKAKRYRIPVVDVDLCPPAPKKPRSLTRLSIVCSADRDGPNLLHKLGFSPGYLF